MKPHEIKILSSLFDFTLLFMMVVTVAKCTLTSEDKLSGYWGCTSLLNSLSFQGDHIIVTDVLGNEASSTFEKSDNKIMLSSGEVMTLANDSTIYYSVPIPEYFTKMECECMKGKVYNRDSKAWKTAPKSE